MQQVLTEWRKYLAEEQNADLKEANVVKAAQNFKDLLFLSAGVTGEVAGTTLQPLEKLADLLRSALLDGFKRAGLKGAAALEATTAVESAIAGSPQIVEMVTRVNPTGFRQWLRITISTLSASRPALTNLIRILSKGALPLAIVGAIFDIYSIADAWNELAKTAGKTKNMRAFGALRKIEKEIKGGKYDKPKTSIQNMKLMNILAKALKANPNALEFFPTVVKQLRPDYQKHIKKTAEHYKTNS
tara:strand:+ start:338 stop:1069 length:732 start_codon:yes stop_codon:yes gene_type:complete